VTNLYHILYKNPALTREDIPIELEDLTKRLVESGLLRIDAYNQINFSRLFLPRSGFSTMISRRQLIDEKLLPETKTIISGALKNEFSGASLEKKIAETINRLKLEIQKYVPISLSMEMKLARIVVQMTHPVVIELILLERVQVFFSYSYNIGDVLDIPSWQQSGSNSGMQSTDGKNTSVYISSGGDPLNPDKKEEEDENTGIPQEELTYGSGKPALARAIVIGGQELGHYSDIIRDKYGRYVGRHSATFSGRLATPHCKKARDTDIAHIIAIRKELAEFLFLNIVEDERHVKFYRKNRLKNARSLFKIIITSSKRRKLFAKIKKSRLSIFMKFKSNLYPATSLLSMLEDMAFNLAPDADVYKDPDKNVEEAIACIESLARVPQQRNKWGPEITEFLYPNLFQLYYSEVIPACIKTYETLSGKEFTLYPDKLTMLPFLTRRWIKFVRKVRNIFRRKP